MSDRHPWASAPEPLTLPSGLTVKVKPVRLQALIRVGALDPELLAALSGEADDMALNMRAMAEIATRALVEPRVTSDPKKVDEAKGVFSVDSVPDDDLAAIFAWTQGGDVEAFRSDGAGAGDSAGGEVLADSAE